jgi:hypothetical protein
MTDAYNAIKNAGSASAATAIAVKDFGGKAGSGTRADDPGRHDLG